MIRIKEESDTILINSTIRGKSQNMVVKITKQRK